MATIRFSTPTKSPISSPKLPAERTTPPEEPTFHTLGDVPTMPPLDTPGQNTNPGAGYFSGGQQGELTLDQAAEEARRRKLAQSSTFAVTPPTTTYGPDTDWSQPGVIEAFMQSKGATPRATSGDYWRGKYASPEFADRNYFWQKLQGAEEFGNAGGGGSAAAGASGYGGNTDVFINELIARMNELRQPVKDPLDDLMQLMSLQRVTDLGGAPFTRPEEAALVAQYRDPLTQWRDTQYDMNKERISARGMLPSSGLLDELNKETNQQYTQGLASGSNDLAVRAVNERQARAQQQLSILNDLVTNNAGVRAEDQGRADKLLSLAAMLPELDERRLQTLLAAAGEGAFPSGSIANTILGIGNQNTATQQNQQQLNQNNQFALGQMIATILANLPGGG